MFVPWARKRRVTSPACASERLTPSFLAASADLHRRGGHLAVHVHRRRPLELAGQILGAGVPDRDGAGGGIARKAEVHRAVLVGLDAVFRQRLVPQRARSGLREEEGDRADLLLVDFAAEFLDLPPDVRNVGVTGSVRLEVLAVREIELPGVAIVGEHGPFVVALARLVERDAADVALHGLDAGHCDRRSFGDRILRGGEIRHLRERFAPVQGVLRLAERRAGVLQHGGDGGGFLALEFLEAPFDVSLPRLDGGRVVVAGVADVGEAFLDDVAPRERAGLGENGLELGEVAEDAGEEEGFKRDPLARATLRAGRGERVEGVEGGVDHAALLGRHVGDRPEGGGVFGGG